MSGLIYQLKSVRKDKFCIMTFLLPLIVAFILNFIGAIDFSTLSEFHFGVIQDNLPAGTISWLERYGAVTEYKTQEDLIDAVNDPSTNFIGVEADGNGIKTMLSGDEMDLWRQTADTLPALYRDYENAEEITVTVLERPDPMEGFQNIFIAATLIVAMFMGCTFNAMNIIEEKESGVALVNQILPMTHSQYIIQKNFCWLCLRRSVRCLHSLYMFPIINPKCAPYVGTDYSFGICSCIDRVVYRRICGKPYGRSCLYQGSPDHIYCRTITILSAGSRRFRFDILQSYSVQCNF